MNKIQLSTADQIENLIARDDRLYRMLWDPRTSQRRRETMELIRNQIFLARKRLRWALIDEERDAMWPNGLPAHP